MDNKRQKTKSKDVATKNFDPSDYKKTDDLSKGLAITHEQVSDTATEGTIDGKIDELKDDDTLKTHDGDEIPRKGYQSSLSSKRNGSTQHHE